MAGFVTMGAHLEDCGQTMEQSSVIKYYKTSAEIGTFQLNSELHTPHFQMVVMRGTTTPVMW